MEFRFWVSARAMVGYCGGRTLDLVWRWHVPHFEHCVNCIETPAIEELIEEDARASWGSDSRGRLGLRITTQLIDYSNV